MIQKDPQLAKLEQKTHSVMTILLVVMLVLLIQLWLLNIAMESYLAVHIGLALPTFLASGFCFLLNLAALRYLYSVDKRGDQ